MNLIEHDSWKVVDSTKIQAFLECPRAYFYEYILGWRQEYPNIHFEFGKAWHLAMEHMLLNDYSERSIVEAFTKFIDHYRMFFSEEQDELFYPKTPNVALNALVRYARTYATDKHETLFTEIAGTVPMDDSHLLSFRMDSILNIDGQIRSREHKTGSTLSRQWRDQWSLAIQTFVYNHVLYCLYPEDQVWGVEINGAFFHKKKEAEFERVPARRSLSMLQAAYWMVLETMYQIDFEMDRLGSSKDEDPVMMCFPMNPTNCNKYFGCKYHDFCLSWANPLQRADEIPTGFKIEYWNPRDEESKAKKVFHIEKGAI